jgi:hypothetical protein
MNLNSMSSYVNTANVSLDITFCITTRDRRCYLHIYRYVSSKGGHRNIDSCISSMSLSSAPIRNYYQLCSYVTTSVSFLYCIGIKDLWFI